MFLSMAGLECDAPTSTFLIAGITGMHHQTQQSEPCFLIIKLHHLISISLRVPEQE
jgi:hypothetical protein